MQYLSFDKALEGIEFPSRGERIAGFVDPEILRRRLTLEQQLFVRYRDLKRPVELFVSEEDTLAEMIETECEEESIQSTMWSPKAHCDAISAIIVVSPSQTELYWTDPLHSLWDMVQDEVERLVFNQLYHDQFPEG